jgi:hypothetical protein
MSPEHGVTVPSSPAITDMTHSIMTYEAMLCQRKMYELAQSGISNWSGRLQLVAHFGAHVEKLKYRIGASRAPLHILIMSSGQKIHRSLELLLRRPPYRQPLDTVPLLGDFDIMLAATEVLELHLQTPPPELSPWAWKNWVQWHALAVVLAELLTKPSGPLADRAIAIASKSFRYYAHIVADSQSGMLWKPIARLMRRVQRVRQASVASQEHSAPPRPAEGNVSDTGPPSSNDDDMFEGLNWSLDEEMTVPLVDHESWSLGVDDEQTPWLAWDSFLQDMVDTSAWE